jgi:MarR family transcriptional regulator, organic hydroperoxide resistance regulator
MLGPKSGTEPSLDCSREEMRAMILMGAWGQTTMTSLADRLGVPLSTATHTVDRLVAKSLAVRARTEEDRRVVQVELSDYGKKLQAKFRIKHLAMARSWLEPLSAGERELFLHLMAKITKLAQPGKEEGEKRTGEGVVRDLGKKRTGEAVVRDLGRKRTGEAVVRDLRS